MADWTPLRTLLADVDTAVTLAWSDLDRLVGGLPHSAYAHSAFWKGSRSGWPGFTTSTVKVGNSVTFVRVKASPDEAPSPVMQGATPTAGAPDLILIGCVKQKLAVPAPAKDLYTSPLFRKGRHYAEDAGVPWFVLSAEHGLVMPEELLAPYDRRLARSDRSYRQAWGARVVDRLLDEAAPLSGRRVEVHAGSAYVEPIRQLLTQAGATVVEPLAGLKLGPRLAWYGRHAAAAEETRDPTAHDVSDLVDLLTDATHALSPSAILATGGDGLRSPASTRGG